MSLTINYEGRREVVKPTPTQSLSVILQRACEKFKIPLSNHALYDAKGKELDLSLSYRLSGLASGAKLEIKRRAASTARASVLVGLQLPEGGRVQASFPATTRLWDVLLHFEQQAGEGTARLNLTRRMAEATSTGDKKRKADVEPAEGHYLLPALTYMQREVATVADLYRNTLQDLGLDGNGLLRLNFRPTETTLEGVQAELEALQASEAQRLEQHKKAEERKAQLKAAEMERVKRLTEESEKMLDAEREELLRRGKEEAEAEEEARRKQEIERLVVLKEKEMEETFREMERAAFEQTQVEHMRAAMRAHFGQAGGSGTSTATSTSTSRSPEPEEKPRGDGDRMEVEAQQPPKPKPAKKEPVKLEIPDRELRVLPPTDRPFNPKEFEVPESFYEATTDDYRVALQAIKANRMRIEEETQMRTKEMKEKDRLRRIPKYRKTLIKVRFPNRVEVQATFHPLEKAQAVFDLIKSSLAHPDRPFYLFTTPPKERVDLKRTLLSLVMVPAAIVYFSWEDNSGPAVEYLKEELVRDIADQMPAPVSFPQSQPTPSSAGALAALGHADEPPARQPPRGGGARDYSNVVPKWFAAGRK
ncbi:uncharacterized protein ACA1_073410 [Acanthamoeba castellanii str. Neff]|uniref:UBX domain-containing protein n=1 Tax=Acanthamoeba castellanii (strain ATCC 30010 / Neff) TaxID=1257118 RepID=L8HEN7_ACACF|nr:uncharacterized protein ACA1_073410 [Acanthamoeba castellanii str. Neff]ELR23697.1 hypothetical protein ACA1_073410 [Acanthamoeba castellanii str. Neff]